MYEFHFISRCNDVICNIGGVDLFNLKGSYDSTAFNVSNFLSFIIELIKYLSKNFNLRNLLIL